MGKVHRWLGTALMVGAMTSAAWAQMPIKNVTIPIPPIHGGPPVMIDLNPQKLPPGVQAPVNKPFDFFGLLPSSASGMVAQVTQSYVAITDGMQHFKVFTFKQGFQPPADVIAGRQVKVNYKLLDNGLLEVIGLHTTGGKVTASGMAVPTFNVGPGVVPQSAPVQNINVKPFNGVPSGN